MTDNNDDFSHDSAFKNLVMDFPEETVRWLLPGVEHFFGALNRITFPFQEMVKHKLSDQGRRADIVMMLEFAEGKSLLPLIEHKGDKYSFSVFKLAHYTLDLAEYFNGIPLIPIVVFTDEAQWREDIEREIRISSFHKTWLHFVFAVVKLNVHSVELIADSTNPVKHILSPLMKYPRDQRLEVAAAAYVKLSRLTDLPRFEKYTDFIDKYAKIDTEERRALETLVHGEERVAMMKQYWFENGQKEGKLEGKMELARD